MDESVKDLQKIIIDFVTAQKIFYSRQNYLLPFANKQTNHQKNYRRGNLESTVKNSLFFNRFPLTLVKPFERLLKLIKILFNDVIISKKIKHFRYAILLLLALKFFLFSKRRTRNIKKKIIIIHFHDDLFSFCFYQD